MLNIGKRLGFLLESKLPIVVLVGAIILGMVGNSLYELSRDPLGGPANTLIVGFLLILLLAMIVDPMAQVREWIRTRLRTSPQISGNVQRRKGLIALVSVEHGGRTQATEDAIAYHRATPQGEQVLRWCWLISGPGESDPARQIISSGEKAKQIKRTLEEAGVLAHILPIRDESQADDPLITMGLVEQAYSEAVGLGLGPEDMIADYTGGTKTMTVGMLLACSRPGRRLQFMKPRAYGPDGTADRKAGSEPREVSVAFSVGTSEEPKKSK